jgi:serine protease Do
MIGNKMSKKNPKTNEMEEGTAAGAGVLIDSTHVITVMHLLDEDGSAPDITITTKDGREIHATVIDTDKINDLMVLKLDSSVSVDVTTRFSCVKPTELGRSIYTIGQPNGWERMVTFGWLSVVQIPDGKDHPHIPQWIANLAAFHGNSGGGTFDNITGAVIGITDAIAYWRDEFGTHPGPLTLMVDPAAMCGIMAKNNIDFKKSK